MATRQPGPEFRPGLGPLAHPAAAPVADAMARLALEALLGLHWALTGRYASASGPLASEALATWASALGEGLRLEEPADWIDLTEILLFHEDLLLACPPEELPFWLLEGLYGLRDDLKDAGLYAEPKPNAGEI